MIVNITDYGDRKDKKFIEYTICGLSSDQLDYLKNNLKEEIVTDGEELSLTMYFDEKFYPFQSDVAKIRLDDFIAREEIEMSLFIASFLEDM